MNKVCNICLYDNLSYQTIHINKHKYLFLEGDKIDKVFLIKKGLIKISKLYENGDEKILDILGPNDFVALLSILKNHEHYIASASTLTDVTLQELSIKDVHQAYQTSPNFKDTCLNCAASRVGVFQHQLIESANQNTEEKILNTLKFLYRKFGEQKNGTYLLNLPITKTDLASIIGIRRETLSRKLSNLEKNKVLTIHKNTYEFFRM